MSNCKFDFSLSKMYTKFDISSVFIQLIKFMNTQEITVTPPVKKVNKLPFIAMILLAVSFLILAGAVTFSTLINIPQSSDNNDIDLQDDNKEIDTNVETNTESETELPVDETQNWLTYTGNNYSIKYPGDWTVVGSTIPSEYASNSGFDENFPQFTSPSGENDFLVAPAGYLVYGFGPENLKSNRGTVVVKNKEINYSETFYGDENENPINNEIFTYIGLKNAYSYPSGADCTADYCGRTVPYSVHFGNTYPIASTQRTVNLDTYKSEQEIFFKILGTIEFKQSL